MAAIFLTRVALFVLLQDLSLRSRDPSWGIRDLEDVVKAAEDQGLYLVESTEMPANNLILLFRKRAASSS